MMIKLILALMCLTVNAHAVTPLTDQKDINAAFAKHRPMVIMFTATWCPACRLTLPQYVEAEKTLKNKVDFYVIDADNTNLVINLKMKRDFTGIPAFVCGKTAKDIRSAKSLRQGGMPAEGIIDYVNKWTK